MAPQISETNFYITYAIKEKTKNVLSKIKKFILVTAPLRSMHATLQNHLISENHQLLIIQRHEINTNMHYKYNKLISGLTTSIAQISINMSLSNIMAPRLGFPRSLATKSIYELVFPGM